MSEEKPPIPKVRENGNRKPRLPRALKITARVLTDQGMSQQQVADELNVGLNTVKRSLADPLTDKATVEKIKGILAGDLYAVAKKLAGFISADEEKLKRLNPYQQALVMAICIDKAKVMDSIVSGEGRTESIVAQAEQKLGELSDIKKKLLKSILDDNIQEGVVVPVE